ncbi:NAD-dependent epimerase/dehydratase [Methanosalsum zhilinae DSM 4017]|uniref:GDP-L-fucose synthase n=1 Tax=Methanosalsum zhilinae (strain DSM 4017 / NBRC 107636 / OCM 62 / WeN5) TaxID=679901 RepID=F7XPV7_METZD|nr:GDP-L-fucose synthase [Methanosalsum zhilinae]AEH61478.1 NAD-dependent epimerase/dehydratase [Methanosalsum zhilinae DSM 4017]
MENNSKIYVAGHRGLVGSAIMRKLESKEYSNLIYRTHKELDLTDQKAVNDFFEQEKPDYVFLAAAKVGGILANSTYPAEFIYDNLMIETNVIHAAYKNNVKKLLFLGSSCIYPKHAPQPMKEEYLLTGELEPTNEAYAIAKIAGIKLCKYYNQQYGTNFISVMPTNLYGPNDNFDLKTSHVLPALIRKFHEAKINKEPEVVVWGTGKPRREFLHVDDMADACVYLMENFDAQEIGEFVNVGVGEDISISELAEIIKKIFGFEGEIVYNNSRPDGTPQKLLDVTRLNELGWNPKISLENGIKNTYRWYMDIKHD